MEAVMDSEMPFASGCEPMKLLAGPAVPAQVIERAAEAIGAEIASGTSRKSIAPNNSSLRRFSASCPPFFKQNIPKMYVLMDGVQVPVVAAETEGRAGRSEGQRARTRECKLGCVFTQTTVDQEGWPIRDPDSTTYVGAIETADEFGFRIYIEAWHRGSEWASLKIVIGDGAPGSGISPTSTFPAPFKSSTFIKPGNIYEMWLPCSTPMIRQLRNFG
jgi:hypothetical protein